jgi:predicted ATPase
MSGPGVRHLERIDWSPSPQHPPNLGAWPFTIPAVKQLVDDGGLDVPGGVTFLVGENGSGKSTLVEAMADRYPRTGFLSNVMNTAGPGPSGEDSELRFHIRARTARGASPAGFFLRAEVMHDFLAAMDEHETQQRGWGDEPLSTRSHGESFLAVLRVRFADVGVYFMDEPEAALSFRSCLGLLSLLDTMRREGSQVVVATHSPLLMSLPGAALFELGDHGIRRVDRWEDLDLVQSWRSFLEAPPRFLRHLFDD